MESLREYQLEDADRLAGSCGIYFVGDMGIGKTAIAIEAVKIARAERVLVVCPAVAKNNWAREITKWYPQARTQVVNGFDSPVDADYHDFVIVGYDSVSRDCQVLANLMAIQWDVMIMDEAHFAKSFQSNRTRNTLGSSGLRTRAKKTWLLSGTPMPNHAGDLYPSVSALAPNCIRKSGTTRPMTQEEYEQYFCEYRDTTYGRQVSKSINLDILKRRTAGFFHRRRKADVLKELPPVTVSTVELSGVVDPEIKAEIEIALEAILEGVDTAEDILFALQTNESSLAGIRRLTGLAKASLAADHIKMRLEGGQKKIVVFAHHQDVLKALKGLLTKYNPVEISGSVSSADRDTAIELFQDPHSKARVFLGQIQAAGTAITLTQANWVVFAESDWVPANNLQALSRCHRIGQSEPVFVEFMALPGSVDLQIQRAIARKSADIDYMFA